jgi:dTDP-4-dehydrorhamnose reductase
MTGTEQGTVLVTGVTGQVGGAFARLAAGRGMRLEVPGRDRLDLADPASVEAAAARRWRAIVNCGAYTAVDAAEAEPALAHAVNAGAPALLARGAAATGTPLVHVSTDYVFDGSNREPYREDDAPRPINVYGRTKAEGERAVLDASPANAVLRTSWVLSGGGRNFLTTMLRLGRERDLLRVVDDQIGAPTAADDLAAALITVVEAKANGLWHFANDGATSWFGLARHIFAHQAAAGERLAGIAPIPTDDYPTPARRPLNSRLATDKWAARFGRPRPWTEAVDAILDALRGTTATAG